MGNIPNGQLPRVSFFQKQNIFVVTDPILCGYRKIIKKKKRNDQNHQVTLEEKKEKDQNLQQKFQKLHHYLDVNYENYVLTESMIGYYLKNNL